MKKWTHANLLPRERLRPNARRESMLRSVACAKKRARLGRGDVMGRQEINELEVRGPDYDDEAKHFIVCAACGQAIDCRRLGDVFHHEEPGHTRLEEN